MPFRTHFSLVLDSLSREARKFPGPPPQAQAALRASLSCTLAVLAASWLQVDNIWWAGISALVVSQANVGMSVDKGLQRALGTIAGGAGGVILVSLLGESVFFTFVGIFLASLATSYLSAVRPMHYAWGMGGGTAIVVLIGTLPDPHAAFFFAFYRSFEICVGIICALVVGNLVFPRHASLQLRDEALECLELLKKFGLECITAYKDRRYDPERARHLNSLLRKKLSSQKALSDQASKEGIFSAQEMQRLEGLRLALETSAHIWASFYRQVSSLNTLAFQEMVQDDLATLARNYDRWLSGLAQNWYRGASLRDMSALNRHFYGVLSEVRDNFQALRRDRRYLSHGPEDVIHYHQFLHDLTALWRALESAVGSDSSQDDPAEAEGGIDRAPGAPPKTLSQAIWRQAVLSAVGLTSVPLIWMWLDLPAYTQISVSVIIIMQPTTLETQRKIILRNLGCMAGGCLGLAVLGSGLAETFFPWLVIFFIGNFLFSYVNFGNPASAYFGLQAGIALVLTLVHGNGPATSLEPPIARLAGIMMASVMVALLFSLWEAPGALKDFQKSLKKCGEEAAELLRGLVGFNWRYGPGLQNRLSALDRSLQQAGVELELLERMDELSRDEAELFKKRVHGIARVHHDLVAIYQTLPDELGHSLEAAGMAVPDVVRALPPLARMALAEEPGEAERLRGELRALHQALVADVNLVRSDPERLALSRAQKEEMAALYVCLLSVTASLELSAGLSAEHPAAQPEVTGRPGVQTARS